MKRYVSACIACLLAIVLMVGCTEDQVKTNVSQTSNTEKIEKIGTITLLNISEAEYAAIQKTRLNGIKIMNGENDTSKTDRIVDEPEVVFFDSLNDMLMALDSGSIQAAEVSSEVAKYVISKNEGMEILQDFGELENKKDNDFFTEFMLESMLSYDYSFMSKKENGELLKKMEKAVEDMRKDGTMKKLIEKYIDGAMKSEPEVEKIQSVDGRDTIRVVVTGDMPPIDYMTAGGEPTGFNVGVLNEIGNRINKNIELVSANAGARALMLTSGEADIAFWTRSSDGIKYMMEEDVSQKDWVKEWDIENEEDKGWVDVINEKIIPNFDAVQYGTMDIPEGLEISDPYYISSNVLLIKK